MSAQAVVEHMPQQQESRALTPLDMLNQAVERGAGLDVLEKLMTLQERWESNNARKAFERYRARGGIYNPFAATQSAGSYMTAAFDTLNLTDWSRLYGDLLFSPFDSGSQFYQVTAARAPVATDPPSARSDVTVSRRRT